jgi:flagellar hook-length control protein FliK
MSVRNGIQRQDMTPPPPRPQPSEAHAGEAAGGSFQEIFEGTGEAAESELSATSSSGGQTGGQSGFSQGEGGGEQSGQRHAPMSDEELVIHELECKQKEVAKEERMQHFLRQSAWQPHHQVLVKKANAVISGRRIPSSMLDKIVSEVRLVQGAAGSIGFTFALEGDVLGGLGLDIRFDGGTIHATFSTDADDVRALVSGQIDELRKRLEKRGLKVGKLAIRDPKEKEREQKRKQNQRDREEAILSEEIEEGDEVNAA